MYEKYTLQRQNAENLKQIFPEDEYRGLSPNFQIHVSLSDGSAFSAGGNMWTDPGNIEIAHRHINVESGAEATQFPEKEYINGIAVAV
jgi:hypothetical protein